MAQWPDEIKLGLMGRPQRYKINRQRKKTGNLISIRELHFVACYHNSLETNQQKESPPWQL
jgi:hypothetical protein